MNSLTVNGPKLWGVWGDLSQGITTPGMTTPMEQRHMNEGPYSIRSSAPAARARLCAGLLVVLLIAAFTLPPAAAQSYPSRPVTIIVPVTAGSAQDYLARLFAPILAQRLGQPFIVDNRVGASGTIGAAALAKAPPDGHTLMLGAIVFATAPSLQKSLPYDPIGDFAPIGPVARVPMALAIHASVPANNLTEFIALVKSRPGKLNYGSPGSGTPHHLFMELLKQRTGMDFVHVPYKQLGGMVNDLLAGTLEGGFMTVFQSVPQVKAGKLKILGVSGARRAVAAPDLPTFREAGIDGLDVEVWNGFLAPGKTPPEIIARLNAELNRLVELPEIKEAYLKLGLESWTGTPADLAAIIKSGLELWRGVVERGGIKAD